MGKMTNVPVNKGFHSLHFHNERSKLIVSIFLVFTGGNAMEMIGFLILFPFFVALLMACMRKGSLLRRYTLYAACIIQIVCDVYFSVTTLASGKTLTFLEETHGLDQVILIGEWVLVVLVCYYSFKFRKYYCALLSVLQTGLVTWMEKVGYVEQCPTTNHIMIDKLAIIMCLIVGVVGCLICFYAMGYMREYVHHHSEVADRRSFFFAVLFVFLGAMHGLIFSDNMLWIYFFWEITSVCSFLLIGYSQTTEAINNSFKALWMNLLGGLGFAVGIIYAVLQLKVVSLHDLVLIATDGNNDLAGFALVTVALLAFAGLTKSAQMPFSGWLLGAMVAPTPTSALLHSATMVKAGVYLLIRLAPAMAGNSVGLMIATIGGLTFFMASCLAISQSDGKKVLAYSTISNLGLITACAGIGLEEAVWAGILLMMFHAVSKSLLFLTVGAVENSSGSRNIEDMHGLIIKLPGLAYVMIIGIAGMFLAPFGMLVSKWAALKAYVDAGNVLLVVFLVYGSATTLFYWTKWLGSLVAVHAHSDRIEDKTKPTQWMSLSILATLVVVLCVLFPMASTYIIEPQLQDMYGTQVGDVLGRGNIYIMVMMLILLFIMPVMARILTLGKKEKLSSSYMGGINVDNRKFVDSLDQPKQMYLSNWYITEWFGEAKMLNLSLAVAAAILIILMTIAIGGALV